MTFRNTTSNSILILGASARAAAFSALAAGLRPTCGDLFADADLTLRCAATAVRNYPAGLALFARQAPPGPWIYTGGLENHAALVSRISKARALYGNEARTLRRARDPLFVHKTLTSAGLPSPEVRVDAQDLPRDGTWLCKARQSSGGLGIEPWTAESTPGWPRGKRRYFQRYVAGASCAAVFLAARGGARLLGVTGQLLRARQGQPLACLYAGSVGPLEFNERQRLALERIGAVLASKCALTGLFGVDFIDDGQRLWPVEINPRYTSSVEILERAYRFSAIAWHVAACRDQTIPDAELSPGNVWHAKRILFADQDVFISREFTEMALTQSVNCDFAPVADIPTVDSRIAAGRPVMTIFAAGPSHTAALAALDQIEATWRRRLAACAVA